MSEYIVVHGTSQSNAEMIAVEGLKPRGKKGGNWITNVTSNPDLVYLGSQHPEHFCNRACIASEDSKGVKISLDLEDLTVDNLRVDENFIDLEERGRFDNCNWDTRKKQRDAAALDTRWEKSFTKLGMVSYKGIIPPNLLKFDESFDIRNTIYYRDWLYDKKIPVQDRLYGHDHWLSVIPKVIHERCVTDNNVGLKIIEELDFVDPLLAIAVWKKGLETGKSFYNYEISGDNRVTIKEKYN